MKSAGQIIRKEIQRVFSDRKLIFSLFILPAILVIGIYYIMGQMQTVMMEDINAHQSVIYIQNAPEGFSDFVDQSGLSGDITYLGKEEKVQSIKDGILRGDIDLLVVFEDNFLEKISQTEEIVVPEVKTYYNNSEDYSNTARGNFVGGVLNLYKEQLLTQRFGDLKMVSVFDIDRDYASSILVDNKKASGKAFGMILPYFLTMMLFAGAMGLGVDAITGEKERGTMASMLLTPVRREEIVIGKIVSISILSCLSALVYVLSMVVALPLMLKTMVGDVEGLSISFSVSQVLMLLGIVLTLVYFYVALITLASVLAKNTKEASTYVSPMYIVVIVAGMITMFTGNTTPDTAMYVIPVYGSALSIQGILTGELTLIQFAFTILGSVLVSGVLTGCITKAFNSERVMFNA